MKPVAICLFLVFGLISGCGSSDVSLVKKGTMNGYETTTIGNAFDTSFDNPTWEEFQGEKGERVVQFTGNITQGLHDSAVNEWFTAFGTESDIFTAESYPAFLILSAMQNQIISRLSEEDYSALYEESNQGDQLSAYQSVSEICKLFLKRHYWKVGDSVQVQWIVTPDGESFNLTSLASNSWKGYKADLIISAIYN